MTNVLYVAGADFYSGAERALLLTVKSLDPSRYRPVVAVGTRGQLFEELRKAGIPTRHIPIARTDWKRIGRWVRSVTELAAFAVRHKVRLVHANEAPTFQPAGRAARLLRLPAVTHVRFPAGGDGYRWFLKPGYQRALFMSDALRQQAIAEAPDLFTGRSDVVYDAVELPPLPDQDAREAGRSRLGIRPGVPAVAMSGQVVEIKGIWEFLEAARILHNRHVQAVFVVLGDDLKGGGATRAAMEARVRALGLSDSFLFLGFRSDAPRLIPLFDIVAVPSHVEPMGNATLEAMAAARPVVASRVDGIPESVVDGVTGTLVPPRDPVALADAIHALLNDPAVRETFGQAGRRRASERFSLAAHAAALQSTYDALLTR